MTFDELTELINQRSTGLQTRALMATGDLWADGEGWIGPTASATGGPASQFVKDEIKRSFLSQNVLAEVIQRHASGVIGLAPHITTDPAEDEEEAAEGDSEAPESPTLASMLATFDTDNFLIGGWLAKNRVHEALQEAVANVLWAAPSDNQPARAPLRVFIPASELDDAGELPAVPMQESLDRVRVHAPDPRKAGVIRDADGQPLAGWYAYTDVSDGDEVEMLELSLLKATLDQLDLELSGDTQAQADPTDTLILQINVDAAEITSSAAHALGGALTITEIVRRAPLITESAIGLQKGVSLAWTMLGRNTVVAGFLERLIMGAMPPGRWVDASGNEVAPGHSEAVFEPAAFNAGPGTATFLSGVPQFDADGNITGYSSPSVYDRQPVSPASLIETKNEARTGILEECSQVHATMAGDATASGKSREQALQDFSMSLDQTIPALRDAANDTLTAAVRLAAHFSSDGAEYAEASVLTAPRKNLQVTDEDAADEVDESAALERDKVFAARVTQAIQLAATIRAETGESVPWQILLVGNATNTAPAGFLQGAMSQTTQTDQEATM